MFQYSIIDSWSGGSTIKTTKDILLLEQNQPSTLRNEFPRFFCGDPQPSLVTGLSAASIILTKAVRWSNLSLTVLHQDHQTQLIDFYLIRQLGILWRNTFTEQALTQFNAIQSNTVVSFDIFERASSYTNQFTRILKTALDGFNMISLTSTQQ